MAKTLTSAPCEMYTGAGTQECGKPGLMFLGVKCPCQWLVRPYCRECYEYWKHVFEEHWADKPRCRRCGQQVSFMAWSPVSDGIPAEPQSLSPLVPQHPWRDSEGAAASREVRT